MQHLSKTKFENSSTLRKNKKSFRFLAVNPVL
jgi:hypothetical protein